MNEIEIPDIRLRFKAIVDLDTNEAEKKLSALASKITELKSDLASIGTSEKKEIIISSAPVSAKTETTEKKEDLDAKIAKAAKKADERAKERESELKPLPVSDNNVK